MYSWIISDKQQSDVCKTSDVRYSLESSTEAYSIMHAPIVFNDKTESVDHHVRKF